MISETMSHRGSMHSLLPSKFFHLFLSKGRAFAARAFIKLGAQQTDTFLSEHGERDVFLDWRHFSTPRKSTPPRKRGRRKSGGPSMHATCPHIAIVYSTQFVVRVCYIIAVNVDGYFVSAPNAIIPLACSPGGAWLSGDAHLELSREHHR